MKLPPLKVRVFDVETNGLLPHSVTPGSKAEVVKKVHVLVIHDVQAGWYRRYRINDNEDTMAAGLKVLSESDLLIGHNIIKYDIPVLEFLYPGWTFPREKLLDTLVLSRLIHANLKDQDVSRMRSGKLPGRLFGSHSLEAWGYRSGVFKDEYEGDPDIADEAVRKATKWARWNQTMEDYCEQDVRATRAIFDLFTSNEHYFKAEADYWGSVYAVKLEHQTAVLMAQMEANGFPFDERGAGSLYAELAGRRQELLTKVVATFGSWWKQSGGTEVFKHPVTGTPLPKYGLVKYPKTGALFLKDGKTLSKTPYYEGAPYTPIELVQFNPGSRDHIAKVLMDRGWEPVDFTEGGKPQIDEEVLGSVRVKDPEAQAAIELIAEYMLVVKRLGQVSEGDNAWLRLCNNGRIHGSINPNGAVTGRATHAYPNMAQVPSGTAIYGPQCRALFGAKYIRHLWPDAVQCGTDASGLELRCLGHFMAKFDQGKYIDVLLNGDIHWLNVESLGLVPKGTKRDKQSHKHDEFRANAKTFIYAFLYGAGDAKIGSIVGGGKAEGKRLKTSFMNATPAIAALRENIEAVLVESSKWVDGEMKVKWKRNWLKGLDGRKLHVRSPHSALNTLLQSAGALACKLWLVYMEQILQDQGLKHGFTKDGDYALVAWVHDEAQVICRNQEVAHKVAAASEEAMRAAGEFFGFQCPLATESKFGPTWAECH